MKGKSQSTTLMGRRLKNILAWLLVWLVAVALVLAGWLLVYRYRLRYGAPDVMTHLRGLLPSMTWLPMGVAELEELSREGYMQAMATLESNWIGYGLATLAISVGAAHAIWLIWNLLFRLAKAPHRRSWLAYGLFWVCMLCIAFVNGVLAYVTYQVGYRHIADPVLWDMVVCFGGFVIVPCVSFFSFRWIAPLDISAPNGFFSGL